MTMAETDFFAWAEIQAAALRRRDVAAIDWTQLAEEIEDLGRSERRAVESLLMRMIEHLLKLQHSPATDPRRGWADSVWAHRAQVRRLLEANPSLRQRIDLDDVFAEARSVAAKSLAHHDHLPDTVLPSSNPFSLDQLLDDDWWG